MHRAPIAALLLVLAGCGTERAAVPDVRTPQAPDGQRTFELPRAGVVFTAPGNWLEISPREGLVAGVASGTATLAVWRYPRTEPLPKGRAQLRRVRGLLVDRVRQRDPSFEPGPSRVTRRAGAPAIELTGTQTIAGQRVRVRSSHVFGQGAEVVVDAYANPRDFERLDSAVFSPTLRSLRLRIPVS